MSESESHQVGEEEGSTADGNGVRTVEPAEVPHANTHSEGFVSVSSLEESEAGDVKMAEDGGREDMFVDCPDEIETSETPQDIGSKNYVQDTHFEGTSSEMKTPDLEAEIDNMQTPAATKDNLTHESEVETSSFVRELAHLRSQLEAFNEHQSSVTTTNDNVLVEDLHRTDTGLGSSASLHGMISDCCNFLIDATHERSNTESRIRELDAILRMKDQEIEALNTKVTELSVLKDVALSHLNSEQENSLCMHEVQNEAEQQLGEMANAILASLAMVVCQEEGLPEESVVGKLFQVQKTVTVLVEKYDFFLSQIDQLRCGLAEVVPDISAYNEMGILVAARDKIIELKAAENLTQSLSHLSEENRKLTEELDKHKSMLDNANSEIAKLNVEVEQEKARYTNTKEKLTMAVTKGKALVQQRDVLKQSLAEKTSELDKCLVELQEKSNALEVAEQTMELLRRKDELANSLQDDLLEKDNILVKCGEILSDVFGPEQLALTDISESIRCLAEERNSLKDMHMEFQKVAEVLSSFDFPESMQSSASDARVSWLLESFYAAKEEAGKLQEEMAASNEAAGKKIDQLMASLLMETQEKNNLREKLHAKLGAAREEANNVIDRLTTSFLVETQEKFYTMEELGNLTREYEEISQKEHHLSWQKDNFVNSLLEAAGVKVDNGELGCHQQSDICAIIEKCIAKIKEDNTSFDSSYIQSEIFQSIQNALYTRDLELKLYESMLAEEMLNNAELKHVSSELVMTTKELHAVRAENNSLQKNLEQYEEKVALLKEKLSMAVKKGKGVVQERENLKRTMEDKNVEIEKIRSELEQQLSIYNDCKNQIDKLSADLGVIPKLEADLASIKDQKDQLQQFLAESNMILQKVMESLDCISPPAVSGFEGPVEKVKWLIDCLGECEKAKIEAERELALVKDETTTLTNKLLESQATIKSLTDSLSIAENSIHELQEEKKEQESTKTLTEQELQRTMDALSLTEISISQLLNDKNDLESAKTLLEQELQKAVGEASAQKIKYAEVCAIKESLEDTLALAEKNISVLMNEKEEILCSRDATQLELQKMQEEYSVDKDKLAEAYETIRSLEVALGRERENISVITEESTKARIGITHLEAEIRKLKEEAESQNSKLDDASITIKSLEGELERSENKVFDLVNEKKNAEQEISELNFKLSNCLEDLARSQGSIEMKDTELLSHFRSLLKDGNILYTACQNFEKKLEGLNDLTDYLKEMEDLFPEVNFKVLQGHPLLKDDSSRSSTLLTGFDDVPDMEMANEELNASHDETITSQILKNVKQFHHKNKIVAESFDGHATVVGHLITLFPKLIKSLKQNMEDMETDRQSLQHKIDVTEGNLKVLYSACVGATQELNSENSSSLISDILGEDSFESNGSNYKEAAEKLTVAARDCQNLRKQFQNANDQMLGSIKDLQNKLTETIAACEKDSEEREIYKKRVSQLEADLDEAREMCSELRLKLEDHQAKDDRLKETVAELTALKSTLSSRGSESEDTLLSASQMESLFDKLNEIEIPIGGLDLGNQDIHADVRKLFYVVDSFTGLQNQINSLSCDKKELQSTLARQKFEIEHLNEEQKNLNRDKKDCEKMKDELLEVTIGLENLIQRLGGNNLVGAQKVPAASGLLPVLDKLVMAVIFESGKLKSQKEEVDAQLFEMKKAGEKISSKVSSLESSFQVEAIPREIDLERDTFEAASLPAESEISEIHDTGSTATISASTSVPSAAHVRTLRKGSTDHLALTIDSGSERLLNHDEANEDKGHLFKSLITTGLVPRQGRILADRIDGIWVSSGRALMSRPRARIGLILYSFLLHIWLLGTIL
ncbi:unnamed protein product [Cuscuta campestris]|uniref:Uncharacterized protein n=1 Tax=Cuscuta campestris TaxID=132261 RepID=A0A484MHZ0_9ASTE|nr:unnamed protein product [Cuscuta campestris]